MIHTIIYFLKVSSVAEHFNEETMVGVFMIMSFEDNKLLIKGYRFENMIMKGIGTRMEWTGQDCQL